MMRPARYRKPRFIVAIVWDHHEMLAAVARRKPEGIELVDTCRVTISEGESAATAAGKLAEELAARNVASHELLIGLARSHIELLRLELPPANPSEMPDMVRNEVARQIPDLPDDAPIDFWLPHEHQEGEPLIAEVAAIRPETNDLVSAVCEQLGQSATQVVIRSMAVSSLFAKLVPQVPRQSLLLNMLNSTADISVLHGSHTAFTRSVHLQSERNSALDVAQLADEIRRTLYVAPRASDLAQDDRIEHVYMFADLDRKSPFVEQLAHNLQLTVSLLDPLSGMDLPAGRPEGTHRFAALIGMIRDRIDGSATVDFINPRRAPKTPRSHHRWAAYAVLAVTALAAVTFVLRRDLNATLAEAEALETDVEHNRALLKKIESKTVILDAVQRWEDSEIDWLGELRRLSERFPPADKAVVQRITMAPSNGTRGVISMSVRVQDPAIVAELEKNLRDANHHVSSQRISTSDPDEKFSTQFETSLIVTPHVDAPSTAESPTDTQR